MLRIRLQLLQRTRFVQKTRDDEVEARRKRRLFGEKDTQTPDAQLWNLLFCDATTRREYRCEFEVYGIGSFAREIPSSRENTLSPGKHRCSLTVYFIAQAQLVALQYSC